MCNRVTQHQYYINISTSKQATRSKQRGQSDKVEQVDQGPRADHLRVLSPSSPTPFGIGSRRVSHPRTRAGFPKQTAGNTDRPTELVRSSYVSFTSVLYVISDLILNDLSVCNPRHLTPCLPQRTKHNVRSTRNPPRVDDT